MFQVTLFRIVALLAFAVGMASAKGGRPSIVDIATSEDDFSTLVLFLKRAGLVEPLQGDGPFTVFAPTNDAFEKIPLKDRKRLKRKQWRAHLQALLLYHVALGRVKSTDLSDGQEIETVEGNTVEVSIGKDVKINDATVILPDVMASNGVIHVIDTVLLPPALTDTIVDMGVANEDFSILVDLVVAAGLAERLSRSPRKFTLFAPPNDAFEALDQDTLDELKKPKNKGTLKNILKYHIVKDILLSDELKDGKVMTLSGDKITVDVGKKGIMINDAEVVDADILASNGVIHVIDKVLLP